MTEAKQLREQAEQLRTRMTARVPIKGSLTFLDSRGMPHAMGIDVGQDVVDPRAAEPHRGGDPVGGDLELRARPRPVHAAGPSARILDRRIPVDRFLAQGTIEGQLDRVYELEAQIDEAAAGQAAAGRSTPPKSSQLDRGDRPQPARSSSGSAPSTRPRSGEPTSSRPSARRRSTPAGKRPRPTRSDSRPPAALAADHRRDDLQRLPDDQGEGRRAGLRRDRGRSTPAPAPASSTTSSRSASTTPTRRCLPASVLAGSTGRLRVEVRCLSPTQYLGMAESDLFLLADSGNFGVNYMKGLFGVWLQAMVLTAIGVFAGTFLSWPVALLTTIFVLRRRPARVRLPGRLHPPGDPGRRAVRVADPAADPRQPDDRAGPDRRRRPGQDARLAGHAADVDAGLHRPQLQRAGRHQPVADGFAVSWRHAGDQHAPGPGLRLAVLRSPDISS